MGGTTMKNLEIKGDTGMTQWLLSISEKKKTSGSTPIAKLRRGAISWEPPFPEGEDETSLKKTHRVHAK